MIDTEMRYLEELRVILATESQKGEISPPSTNLPFSNLTTNLPCPQCKGGSVDFLFAFVPGISLLTSKYLNLQSYCQVRTEIPREKAGSLSWLIAKINTVVPIGHFGLFENHGELYWKASQVIALEGGEERKAMLNIHHQIDAFMQFLPDFLATFQEVIDSGAEPGEALNRNKWARQIDPQSR